MNTDFIGAIRAFTGGAPSALKMDSRIHRFSTSGRKGDDAGWYFLPHESVCVAGDWRSGLTKIFYADGHDKDDPEVLAAIQRSREAYRLEKKKAQEVAIRRSAYCLNNGSAVDKNHPYLMSKGLSFIDPARYRAKQYKDRIVLDVMSANGELKGAQYVSTDSKKFATGTPTKGNFHWLQTWGRSYIDKYPDAIIGVVEGFATGITVSEERQMPVIVAFSAGNIPEVIKRLQILYPDNPILYFADDDKINPQTGKKAGEEAARKAKALGTNIGAEFPTWPGGIKPEGASDFNDLMMIKFGLWGKS